MSAADYQARKQKGNKFGAKKKMVDGIGFDSTHEAERYMALRLEEKAGQVIEIRLQYPIHVEVNGNPVFTYICDFAYKRKDVGTMNPDLVVWRPTYEDAKGYRKGSAYQLFRLKKAVIKAALGIEILEV
jgi:hypothetical protein